MIGGVEFLLSPEAGLAGVAVASFLAATLVPLSSEAVLFAYLKLNPGHLAPALAVATLANTAGGMTSYLVGRLIPQRKLDSRAVSWLQRRGAPATFLAFLPFVGDALCVAAGWLRANWLAVLAFSGAGRLLRYLAVTLVA
jgi:membrane protein YqaA with SNARE-associated domain